MSVHKKERGSIVVLVAVTISALLGLASLGTDVGLAVVERQRLAGIADAAALAAAQSLPAGQSAATQAAHQYLDKNGLSDGAVVRSVTASPGRIRVRLEGSVQTRFARILGVSAVPVTAGAAAGADALSGYLGAVPLGVPWGNWQLGDPVTIKTDPTSGSSAGNYLGLALGKNGASVYEENLRSGYPVWLRAGGWVDTETGNMSTPTVRAINHRIQQDPGATFATVRRDSPRLVVVPVLDSAGANGRGQVQIIGFGAFFLEQVNSKGEVQGRFIRMTAVGEANGTAQDFGLFSVRLVE